MAVTKNDGLLAYVGTYTRRGSEGIYIYHFDASSGALRNAGKFTGLTNPSYLARHPSRHYLYAVIETDEFAGKPSGGVIALAIDAETGALSELNRQSTEGAGPCYLSVERTGRHLLVANYASGSLTVLPIRPDGSLSPASDLVQHRGSGADPHRQAGPHAHCIIPDPANRYILAADLGLDRVMVYTLDPESGKLRPNRVPWAQTRPGAGPRHLAFHPSGSYVYLINELDSTLTAFAYDQAQGTLRELQTVSTLPEGHTGQSSCAAVRVHPSGRFVYGSNRGHDSIALFAVDGASGRLTPGGHEPTRGKTPRDFNLDPTGAYLLAANQDSDSIVTFRIDPGTGRLTAAGPVAELSMPVCVTMLGPA